jgi:hypothetical protein
MDGGGPGGHAVHLVSVLRQNVHQQVEEVGLVIHHQDLS